MKKDKDSDLSAIDKNHKDIKQFNTLKYKDRVYSLLTERRKTKRNVNLVSSHSDNERDNEPLATYTTEGSAVSDLYKNDRDGIPSFMRYVPKEGETVVYEEINIPDVD